MLKDPCKYQIGCVGDFIFRVVNYSFFSCSVSVVTSGTNCSVGISVCCERQHLHSLSETLALQTPPTVGGHHLTLIQTSVGCSCCHLKHSLQPRSLQQYYLLPQSQHYVAVIFIVQIWGIDFMFLLLTGALCPPVKMCTPTTWCTPCTRARTLIPLLRLAASAPKLENGLWALEVEFAVKVKSTLRASEVKLLKRV